MRRTLLALPIAALLTVAGCGDETAPARDTLTPQAALVAAAQQAKALTSSRIVLSTTSKVGAVTVDVEGSGLFDHTRQTGQLELTLPGQQGRLQQRFVDGTMYLQLPTQPGVFFELPLDELVDTSLAESTDPTAGLQALAGANADVVEVGREQVRDAETTHYRGTYDVSKALAAVTGPSREVLERTLGSTDLTAVPFDAWVDGEDRLRKLQQRLTVNSPQLQGQRVEVDTTVELYDFGVAVDVQAPPADQVQDGRPLLAQLKGTAGS